MISVALCVPTADSPRWPFVDSIMALSEPPGVQIIWCREGPLAVDTARNILVQRALDTRADYIWMVDSDAVLHPLTLHALLDWNVPAVGALAFQRYGPLFPTVMRGRSSSGEGFGIQVGEVREWIKRYPQLLTSEPCIVAPRPLDALRKVDRTGCHCLLIKREVFEALPQPWFKGNPERKHTQEDMYFAALLEEASIPLYVDFSVTTGHLYGDRSLSTLDFVIWDTVSDYGPQDVGPAPTDSGPLDPTSILP